ncbi:pyrrolidone-carboxylate peptidase family protein [Galdieria sulphuraria]|uniref:Pyrrolidone-carboxylate peptidase family protein n=1 Tax=Galdieria sulphuraria TaxID=130081 RepID=M2XZW0_GALSU|nr:pyrrolidone-carboxylate peptidase family protein [Galdieria sulphuraria]EME29168.1 pyrrolidone-carboxylate peptidase family protein [Galdieria sulphuraria]|eukprot:XP_005705688.1 pyrrolidone-carboxylate peptidase family protein [Galdieria sulphuraria]
MGSLGIVTNDPSPYSVHFHLTGFGRFHRVSQNPTEFLVKQFVSFCEERRGLHEAARVVTTTVATTSVKGAQQALDEVYGKLHRDKSVRNVIIHCGVDASANCFRLEERAYNEASFSCPDESGWQPKVVPIDDTKPVDSFLVTSINIRQAVEELEKKGFHVKSSEDAGRFLCNWIYYQSLTRAQCEFSVKVVFVHFPPIQDSQEIQSYCEFLLQLLNVITTHELSSIDE